MKISQLINMHPSMLYAEEFKNIVKPLQKLGISYFSHVKMDVEGNVAVNASDPNYLTQYYQQECYNFDLHMMDSHEVKRHFLWDIVQFYGKTEQMYKLAWACGLSHIFTILQYENGCKNLYHFAAKPGRSEMNNFYLQHIDLLENFIEFFNQQLFLNDHLNKTYQLTCPTSQQNGGYLIKEDTSIKLHEQEFAEFFASIGANKTQPLTAEQQAHISRRERQCAFYLLEGYTSKEIADKLYLSSRTVEVYLERLRARFGSKNKIQLARHIIEAKLLK